MVKFHMTKEENIFYAKRMIVDSIWKEAHLEGINATFPDTQEIYEGRSVAGLSVEGAVAINNLKHAWWFVLDSLDDPLSCEYIKTLNEKIGAGIISWAGQLREFNAMITGSTYRPPIPSLNSLQQTIDTICHISPGITQGLKAFALFARNQFFPDGNKRTAQLLANKLLINSCSGIFAVPIDEKRNFGKQLVNYYEKDNLEEFIDYLADTCLDGMDFPDRRDDQ